MSVLSTLSAWRWHRHDWTGTYLGRRARVDVWNGLRVWRVPATGDWTSLNPSGVTQIPTVRLYVERGFVLGRLEPFLNPADLDLFRDPRFYEAR